MCAARVLLCYVTMSANLLPLQARHWCYGCHVTPASNNCVTGKDLFSSRTQVEKILGQNGTVQSASAVSDVTYCTDTNPYCVVEEIVINGADSLYYRDCSDGDKFSVDVNGSRLAGLQPDGVTRCAFIASGQVCIQLCDGDFCNGPSSGNHAEPQAVQIYALCVLLLLVKGEY